ncbi:MULTISPECIES: Holliday junction branch migration protein RuvA [unclassified Synechocystis]|uniref:Holliday junction branch migration protein RuvA n=1 Tax=unclassified Synechocystis TaxID=2640012 RepID=UPI00042A5566|nr:MULTISPECIES: Holliday junction branch migration protein RuvA [unclassified Synechocystis]AIE74722.1 Holliday junction DNA helicase RuvA [Synechocystis sp. PCC 6714]MCT0253926.1 Holliday junction branch migration protein RuvA [Synechocystis sp. CS-94]
MIQFLQGQVVAVTKNIQNRWFLILSVNGVGYELQVPHSLAQQWTPLPPEPQQIFTYLLVRQDQLALFGFARLAERDLFGQLMGVTGIGAQLAIALIETLGFEGLVQAVVTANIKQLCQTPGVGKKGAERLALELKTKLSQWHKLQMEDSEINQQRPQTALLDDLEMTLLALGYTQTEIQQAIAMVSQWPDVAQSEDPEVWIRRAIGWLSDH